MMERMQFAPTRRALAALVLLPLLAACMGPADGPVAATPKPYTVSDVSVTIAPGAPQGRFATDPALTSATQAQLDAALTQGLGSVPGGAQDARAEVLVTEMSLRAAGARVLGAVNFIRGQITVRDASGVVLAQGGLAYSHQEKHNTSNFNGIPIGLLVNAARSGSASDSGADQRALVAGFTAEAVDWARR